MGATCTSGGTPMTPYGDDTYWLHSVRSVVAKPVMILHEYFCQVLQGVHAHAFKLRYQGQYPKSLPISELIRSHAFLFSLYITDSGGWVHTSVPWIERAWPLALLSPSRLCVMQSRQYSSIARGVHRTHEELLDDEVNWSEQMLFAEGYKK